MSSIFKPGDVLSGIVELLEFLDQGGQAEIWSVRDLGYSAHANLALKLRYTLWDDRGEHSFLESEKRLEEETRLLGGCQSSYIVTPHFKIGGPIEVDGRQYAFFGVVMDLATEGNLRNFHQGASFKAFSTAEKIGMLQHLARGLHALQHYEIIHNDIKPANILIGREAGHVVPRFADFGFSFQKGGATTRGGTPGYMAPEVLLQTGDPSFESDIYSLGITFYEIMLGQHPLDHLLSEADPMLALKGYYPTHEYIDSQPLALLKNKELADLIRIMCSRTPDRRPHIQEIIAILKTVNSEARTNSEIRPEDLYPQIANRFRWSEAIHRAFGETEQIYFIRGTRPEFDAMYLAERLGRIRLYGYSIFRLLGSSDYVLRVWRRESDRANLDGVLSAYRGDGRGDYEIFVPTLRAQGPAPSAEARLQTSTEALQVLHAILDLKDGDQYRFGRRAGAIVAESKNFRGRAHNRRGSRSIRVLCRVRCKQRDISDELTRVVLREIQSSISFKGVGEIEVLANPGRETRHAEFLVIAELANFHVYAEVLQRVERAMSALLGQDVVAEFSSLFEMDSASKYESYDGRILGELYKHRQRRGP